MRYFDWVTITEEILNLFVFNNGEWWKQVNKNLATELPAKVKALYAVFWYAQRLSLAVIWCLLSLQEMCLNYTG